MSRNSGLIRSAVCGCLLSLFARTPAYAQTVQPSPPAQQAAALNTIHLPYTMYSHWLVAAHDDLTLTITDRDYSVSSKARAGGLLSLFMKLNVTSSAKGKISDGTAIPEVYDSYGKSRGEFRHVTIRYTNGRPSYLSVNPPEDDREKVPENLQATGTNVLSAVVQVLLQVRKTGTCDRTINIFDGMRLSKFTFRSDGQGKVPRAPDERTAPALRCAFTGYQVAGFVKTSKHRKQLSEPHGGTIWFQDVPGVGIQAVRIELDHPKTGPLVIALDDHVAKTVTKPVMP